MFLAENDFLVGLSVDGPKAVHDRYRVDRAGRPTFDAVMRGLEVLQRHGVRHNALTTVHRANGGKGRDVYRFLTGKGFDHIQFIPIVERSAGESLAGAPQQDMAPKNKVTEWSVAARAYGKFLCDVFDLWFKDDVGRVSVQFFDVQLGLWMGQPSTLCVLPRLAATVLPLSMMVACMRVITTFTQTTSLERLVRRPCAKCCGVIGRPPLAKTKRPL